MTDKEKNDSLKNQDKNFNENFTQEKDCNFKQLTLKTQECEGLKEEIEVLKDNFDTATRDCNELIEELKQECEELKEENEELNKRNNFLLRRLEVDDNDTSLVFKLQNELQQKSNEFYHAVVTNVKFSKEVDRYRKALEEIELTIKNLEKDNILTFPDFTLQENATIIINQCNQGYRDILDIINKAKGETNE